MTHISLRELIDDILLIVRNNNVSESEDLSRKQIATWIDSYTQYLIKERIDKQKNGTNDDELEDVIEGYMIREKGPLELEVVKSYDSNPTFTRKTITQLKNVYNDDGSSILSVHDQNGCLIQYMDHGRRHYHYARKYTSGELTAYYDDGYIYIQGTQDCDTLKYIWVSAIYSTFSDVDDDGDASEDDIKIPAWMVPTIKTNIMKNELAFMLDRPSDDDNDATLTSVKPYGPQDKQKQ